jgi:hypothetical protein
VLQSNCGPRVSQFAEEGQGVNNAEGTKNFPIRFRDQNRLLTQGYGVDIANTIRPRATPAIPTKTLAMLLLRVFLREKRSWLNTLKKHDSKAADRNKGA